MKGKDIDLKFVGRKPATQGAEAEDAETVVDVKDVKRAAIETEILRGPRGLVGPQGELGRRGRRGVRGEEGATGADGRDGTDGIDGLPGAEGLLGRQGDTGPQGPKGETGPIPRHKWEGTRLSFEGPDGKFGRSVNLQGPGGGRGGSGRSANPGYSSISLVGTDLIFARDTAGPLGPGTTVDLSPIAGGSGGFAGLGAWRSRTETGTPPSSGQIRFNNADPELATELYVHETNSDGEDLANFLALVDAGDVIYIQDKGDATKFIVVEVSSNTDNGAWVTFGLSNVAQQGGGISQNTEVNLVASIAGGGAGSVVTGLTTAADGDDITLTQTSGGNQVAVTSDFLWKPGKPGGQTAYGGNAAGELLTLQGSDTANRGRVVANGGITIDWDFTSDAVTTGGLRWAQTIPSSGGAVTSFMTIANNITVDSGLFILSAVDDLSTLRWTVAPGFAVATLFFARPTYYSTSAGIPPSQAFIFAAQAQYRLTGAGDVTTPNYRALSFAPIIRVDNSGDRMRITNTNAVTVSPLYNTRNNNSTADFGTIRGVHMLSAATVFLGQALGTEIASNWIGVDMEALTGLTVSGVKAAVRSAIPASGVANYVILNTSSAPSQFGTGGIHVNDNTPVQFGGAAWNSQDVSILWQTAGNYLQMFFASTADSLALSSPGANRFLFSSNDNAANEINFDYKKFAFGQAGAVGNQVGVFVANTRTAGIAGGWADFLLTQAGSLTIGAFAMSDVSAWVINPISFGGVNTGSIADLSTLVVGMTTSNPGITVTRRAALRITGRKQQSGLSNFPPLTPASLVADANDYAPATLNANRQVWRVSGTAARNITGISVEQVNDTVWITNVGAFTVTLQDQNAGSAAANRIISPSGADYILDPDESALLWYDDTTARWRILYGTGA